MSRAIIVSAVQPTGNLHIGNYLGALKQWQTMQAAGDKELIFFIADLHSLTGTLSAEQLRQQRLTCAAEILALGIDPSRVTFFAQSDVVGHAELAWIFSCVTPITELSRMTQFKDKSQKQEKNITAGLLTYPILQAADILLYHGSLVPVGIDQVQHVEITRDIGRWFNNRYGDYFPDVQHQLTDVPKVMGLLEPTKKMSKSDGESNVLFLADEPDALLAKLKRAVTATAPGVAMAPGVANLIALLGWFGAPEAAADFTAQEQAGTIRYADLKTKVAEVIGAHFADFRNRRRELLAEPEKIHAALAVGAHKAQAIADRTIAEVRKKVGLTF